MIFPKFIDRTEIGLADSLNKFHNLIKTNCPKFDEIFRIVPSNTSIWIETHELGSNYWNGKRTKIANRGDEFDLNQTYSKINNLISENLKIKAIQEIKSNQKLEIENVLKKHKKQNQFSVNVEIDSYEITLYWKKLFVLKIFHAFGSDTVIVRDFIFYDSFYVSTFKDLENRYFDAKLRIEELTDELETNVIPFLPKF